LPLEAHLTDSSPQASRILVVGPSWVGDMVMAQSLFMTLKQRRPEPAVDVLAPEWSEPLLARMPEVDCAVTMPLGHGQLQLGTRRRLGRSLGAGGYTQAIILPNSLKSALVPWWARIKRRTGYVGEWRWGLLNDARRLDRRRLPMTVQRFVALGLDRDAPLPPVPQPHLQVRAEDVEQALVRLQLVRPEQGLLALCPGAEFGPAKRWPAEHYAAVAHHYLDRGGAVWVFGSTQDAEVAQAVCDAAGGCVNLAGRTRLEEAIDLMSLADAVVSNDSGLMHVAAALQRPLVAVYGSSDPAFTPPLSDRARVVRLGLDCSPCFKRECPLGHLNCLRRLEPRQVEQALAELTS
jgi:heptosyltransferase-2